MHASTLLQALPRSRQLAVVPKAVAATEKPSAGYHQWYQPAGKGESFYTGDDGYQYVDSVRVDDVRKQVVPH